MVNRNRRECMDHCDANQNIVTVPQLTVQRGYSSTFPHTLFGHKWFWARSGNCCACAHENETRVMSARILCFSSVCRHVVRWCCMPLDHSTCVYCQAHTITHSLDSSHDLCSSDSCWYLSKIINNPMNEIDVVVGSHSRFRMRLAIPTIIIIIVSSSSSFIVGSAGRIVSHRRHRRRRRCLRMQYLH